MDVSWGHDSVIKKHIIVYFSHKLSPGSGILFQKIEHGRHVHTVRGLASRRETHAAPSWRESPALRPHSATFGQEYRKFRCCACRLVSVTSSLSPDIFQQLISFSSDSSQIMATSALARVLRWNFEGKAMRKWRSHKASRVKKKWSRGSSCCQGMCGLIFTVISTTGAL